MVGVLGTDEVSTLLNVVCAAEKYINLLKRDLASLGNEKAKRRELVASLSIEMRYFISGEEERRGVVLRWRWCEWIGYLLNKYGK